MPERYAAFLTLFSQCSHTMPSPLMSTFWTWVLMKFIATFPVHDVAMMPGLLPILSRATK